MNNFVNFLLTIDKVFDGQELYFESLSAYPGMLYTLHFTFLVIFVQFNFITDYSNVANETNIRQLFKFFDLKLDWDAHAHVLDESS